jgi:hypothetical protein
MKKIEDSFAAKIYIGCNSCEKTLQYNRAVETGWKAGLKPFTYYCKKCQSERIVK